MNEQQLKELLQQSKIETSPDFTDNLMNQIELTPKTKKSNLWSFPLVLSVISLVAFVISYLLYTSPSAFFQAKAATFKTPVLLIVSVSFLLVINYVIKMNEIQKKNIQT